MGISLWSPWTRWLALSSLRWHRYGLCGGNSTYLSGSTENQRDTSLSWASNLLGVLPLWAAQWSPGSILEMWPLHPHQTPPTQSLHFSEIPRWFAWILMGEDHWHDWNNQDPPTGKEDDGSSSTILKTHKGLRTSHSPLSRMRPTLHVNTRDKQERWGLWPPGTQNSTHSNLLCSLFPICLLPCPLIFTWVSTCQQRAQSLRPRLFDQVTRLFASTRGNLQKDQRSWERNKFWS